jgi:hypothetical protein
MKLFLCAASLIAAAVIAYYGFVLACPETSHLHGLDIRNYFEEKKDLDELVRLSEELKSANQCILQKLSRKQIIVRNLIDGRITLPDASEVFLTLDRAYPDSMAINRRIYPSGSDEESSAMQVLAFVRVRAYSDPTVSPDVVTRLEMELKKMRE